MVPFIASRVTYWHCTWAYHTLQVASWGCFRWHEFTYNWSWFPSLEGQAHQLFAVTPSSVTLFSLHDQPPRRQTLDQIGCQTNVVAMSDRMVRMASSVFAHFHLLFLWSYNYTDLVHKSSSNYVCFRACLVSCPNLVVRNQAKCGRNTVASLVSPSFGLTFCKKGVVKLYQLYCLPQTVWHAIFHSGLWHTTDFEIMHRHWPNRPLYIIVVLYSC